MRTFVAFVVASLGLGSMVELACSGTKDPTGSARATENVTPSATAAEKREEDAESPRRKMSADSSPFIAGVWKFIGGNDGGTPSVDTEFRFINPTDLTVTLEYAFFEEDGTFCGCDRDTFTPNKTTVYTVLGESRIPSPVQNKTVPFLFSCKGIEGALKAIVFKNNGEKIFFDDATQIGFQTHAFGGIMESGTSPNFNFLVGTVMTEAAMTGVAISDSTRDDARVLHQDCIGVNGPLSSN